MDLDVDYELVVPIVYQEPTGSLAVVFLDVSIISVLISSNYYPFLETIVVTIS